MRKHFQEELRKKFKIVTIESNLSRGQGVIDVGTRYTCTISWSSKLTKYKILSSLNAKRVLYYVCTVRLEVIDCRRGGTEYTFLLHDLCIKWT